MDYEKVGRLIYNLRKEQNMTQKELADAMNLSDRTISKWERGIGCPDVSLLNKLSEILGVNIDKILTGDLDANDKDKGNMNNINFFVCSHCGSVLFSTGDSEISCCSRKLLPLNLKQTDNQHDIFVEEVEHDYYVTFDHEMSKTHYISFVAYVSSDRVLLIKLYPEQPAELRFPKMHSGTLYAYCNQYGLWRKRI